MNFSKREWILSIITLSLIQGFIWYAAFVNANSGSALNYVSFAGTLISIILAVLAIGYTYGDSISQKNQSDSLTKKIAVLNEVIKNIQLESNSLKNITEISDKLSKFDERMKHEFSSTHNKVDEITDLLASLQKNDNNNSQELISKDATIEEKVTRGNEVANQIIYLSFLKVDNIQYESNIDLMYDGFVTLIDDLSDENDSHDSYRHLIVGMFLSHMSIYNALGIITIEKQDAEKRKITLNPELKKLMLSKVAVKSTKTDNAFLSTLKSELQSQIGI